MFSSTNLIMRCKKGSLDFVYNVGTQIFWSRLAAAQPNRLLKEPDTFVAVVGGSGVDTGEKTVSLQNSGHSGHGKDKVGHETLPEKSEQKKDILIQDQYL